MACAATGCVVATLLCPVILAAQASSRESFCKNNLKQLGFALHNYHDMHKTFPPGWITRNRGTLAETGISWQTLLLPVMDQTNLYIKIDHNRGFDPRANAKSLEPFHTAVKGLRCPSDTTAPQNPFRGGWATSNYSGNGGHRPFPRWSALPGISFWPGNAPYQPQQSSGLFGPNTNFGVRDIVDGTSNTIMVGERSIKSGAGIWAGVTSNAQENDVITDGSHASRIQHSLSGFSSMHKNVQFLMCDGAVRAIKSDIDSQPNTDPAKPLGLFQKLMSRSDGQPLEAF